MVLLLCCKNVIVVGNDGIDSDCSGNDGGDNDGDIGFANWQSDDRHRCCCCCCCWCCVETIGKDLKSHVFLEMCLDDNGRTRGNIVDIVANKMKFEWRYSIISYNTI